MSKTKSLTLYAVVYPGWQDSIFPPAFYPTQPALFPGAYLATVEVRVPEIPHDAMECGVAMAQLSEPHRAA